MSNSLNNSFSPKRDGITLVLRNFNYPFPNAITSPSTPSVTFNRMVTENTLSNRLSTVHSSTVSSTATNKTSDTSSSQENKEDDGIGPDQKIEAYVDFSDFYRNFNKAKKEGTLPGGLDF